MAMPGEIYAVPAWSAEGDPLDTYKYQKRIAAAEPASSKGIRPITAIFREDTRLDQVLAVATESRLETEGPPSVLSIASSYGLEAITTLLLLGDDKGKINYTGIDNHPRVITDANTAEYTLTGPFPHQDIGVLQHFGLDIKDNTFNTLSLFREIHDARFLEADASDPSQMECVSSADVVLCNNLIYHLLARSDGDAILAPLVTNIVSRVAMGGVLSFGYHFGEGMPEWLDVMELEFADAGLQPVLYDQPKEEGGIPFAFQRVEG